ncbi:MAG: anti-sigma factor [Acidobacteria bacterium]|nr:anti-sigma factor [Acidobacteriota bacterium]MCA1609342.1 anti-sigma factor [Acidobacteriota bacterium]
MHSDRFEELAALRALGIPLGADEDEFAQHLEGCATCQALVADFTDSAAALSATATPVAPPASLKTRILGSLESGAVSPRASGGGDLSSRVKTAEAGATPQRSFAPWVFAAAAGLLLLLLVTDDARLRREREDLRSQTAAFRAQAGEGEDLRKQAAALQQEKANLSEKLRAAQRSLARRDLQARVVESDDVQLLFLQGKAPQQRARGRVFWSTRAGRGVVVAGNLSVLPAGKQYELWAFSGGKPVPAGVFDADTAGRVLFESKDLSRIGTPEKFAVTVEPRGGVEAPTGPIVLAGS